MTKRNARHTVWVLAAVAALTLQLSMQAQTTIISNESLVTAGTTFVVNKTTATAKCDTVGCSTSTPMLVSIPVTCPAATGQTCTFHISLDAKIDVSFPCDFECYATGPETSYRFLVDGTAPNPGPTDAKGNYLFGNNVGAVSENTGKAFLSRQSYPASVVATVTNTTSGNHTIDVNLECADKSMFGGCMASAHWSTMKVDVYEP